jgi:hypothetical protein
MEDTILQNKDTIKKTYKSKFEKMWCDKELEGKIKLRYYKDVINSNLEDQNYLFVFPSVKKKISIAKIRTNSHELHSEIGCWSIPKTPWDERVCHLCGTKKVEDEKHFLLDCDPGGYRWPPTLSDWLKIIFWQFWQFTIFSRFKFRGHFEGLNEGFLRSRCSMIAEGILSPQNESPRRYLSNELSHA